MATRPTHAALGQRLEALEAKLADQQSEIERLRAELATQTTLRGQPERQSNYTGHRQAAQRTSRRVLLKLGGAAAVGGALAATANVAQVAHAADNNSILIGSANDKNNQATTTTTLSVVPLATPSNLLVADDSGEKNAIGTVSIAWGALSFGAVAQSIGGYGLVADAGGGIDAWVGGLAGSGRLLFNFQSGVGAPTYSAMKGEVVRDSNGELWLCNAAGLPGTWVKAAHVLAGLTGGVTNYLSKPIRLLDTRVGATDANQHPGSPCSSSTPFTVNVAGINYNSVQVPTLAVGAIGNVTVVAGPSDSSYLEVVPSGAGFTGAANLAYGPNQIVSNAFNVGLSSGNFDIIIGSGTVNVIVDLFAIVA